MHVFRTTRLFFAICYALLHLHPVDRALADPLILNPADVAHYVNEFNSLSDAPPDSAIPNESAAEWMAANVPLFDCPDEQLKKIYYFRWWTYRKHIRKT